MLKQMQRQGELTGVRDCQPPATKERCHGLPLPRGWGEGEGDAIHGYGAITTSNSRRQSRFQAALWIGFLSFALAGCAVGPSYKQPALSAPAAFSNGSQTNVDLGRPVADWWRGFNDPILNDLVGLTLTNNHDLKIAQANLREARALRRESQFDFGPVVNGDAAYTHQLSSQDAVFGFPRNLREIELYDVGFDATWELDVFGHVRRAVEANSAMVQAAEANRRDLEVILTGEVARNYFELRGAQNELAVARRNADNQRQTADMTRARSEGGRGTEFDVARAMAQLNSTLATIPPLEARVAHSVHRLGVLSGQQPAAFAEKLTPPAPLPTLPAVVSIGSPEDLLRRRPDVRAAERSLAAATARIGVATADLFPRLSFTGRLGLEASSIAGLGRSGADTWAFGPHLTWGILDWGHIRARMNAAGARAQAALSVYERTVLTTLEETENALVDFGREQVRRDYLSEAVKASEEATSLAHARFDNGATDFLTVLDAERVLLEAQNQFAQSQTRTATALVAVYKALGGGWEAAPGAAKQQ